MDHRIARYLCLSLIGASVATLPVLAIQPPAPEEGVRPDFDIRWTEGRQEARPALRGTLLPALEAEVGGPIHVRYHRLTGAARILRSQTGRLSPPSDRDPAVIARDFLRRHHALFGLQPGDLDRLSLVRRYRGSSESVTHLDFDQALAGLPVFGARVRIHVNDRGEIVLASSSSVPLEDRLAASAPAISVEVAARLAAADIRPSLPFQPQVTSRSAGPRQTTTLEPGPFAEPLEAGLLWFPVRGGVRLAWEVFVEPAGFPQSYRVLIDAADGRVLFRRNLVDYAAGVGNVLQADTTRADDPRQPDEHPFGDGPVDADDPPNGCPPVNNMFNRDLVAPFRDSATLLFDGGQPDGNNVKVHAESFGTPATGGTLIGGVWHFDFSFNSAGFSETQLFFMTNFAHDFFYDLGFDEASGNFQVDNFGRGGLGADPVDAVSRDRGGRNNASFATPADGGRPLMRMFLWDSTTNCWKADLDAVVMFTDSSDNEVDGTIDLDIVIHEYHHGVHKRLNTAWTGVEASAMGEGGGDFFSYSVHGNTLLAEYADAPNGLRQINGKTYADWTCQPDGSNCSGHSNGQIWANTLWDMRERFRTDLVGGSEESAVNEVHQLYINGLKLSPASPTMLDLRDAMLQDDINRNPDAGAPGGSANHCRMWDAFAGRGLGTNAQDTEDTGDNSVVADSTTPGACGGGGPTNPPNAPNSLSATAVSASQIDLSWNDASADEDGFRVERCSGAGCVSFSQIVELPANTTTYQDGGLSASTTYRYRVRAFNTAGNSGYSNVAEATTDAQPPSPPASPSNLVATAGSSGKGSNKTVWVDLSWQDNSNDEDDFVLDRCVETGKGKNKTCNFQSLVVLTANTTSYRDNSVSRGTTYRYRVKARNAGGDSGYSNEAKASVK